MNKQEKEMAAIYLSACLDEMRRTSSANDDEGYKKASEDYKAYRARIRKLLEEKFDLFCTDYQKTVLKPLDEINKITMVFYSQRVNCEALHYPA